MVSALFTVLFPVLVLANAYFMGKTVSRYVKSIDHSDAQCFVLGFFLYVLVLLGVCFLFAIISIDYEVLLYLFYAAHAILLVVYAWHWRNIIVINADNWKRPVAFLVIAAIVYGVILGTDRLSLASGFFSSANPLAGLSFDSGTTGSEFRTWQMFVNTFALLVRADSGSSLSQGLLIVASFVTAGAIYWGLESITGFWRKVAGLAVMIFGMAAGIFAFAANPTTLWLIPFIASMCATVAKGMRSHYPRAEGTFAGAIALASFTMAPVSMYLSLTILTGFVMGLAFARRYAAGAQFIKLLIVGGVVVSMYVYESNVVVAAVLFFIAVIAAIWHVYAGFLGRQGYVRAVERLFVNRPRFVVSALFVLLAGSGAIVLLVNGLAQAAFASAEILFSPISGSSEALIVVWSLMGIYCLLWLYSAYVVARRKATGLKMALALACVLMGNPFLVLVLISELGPAAIYTSFVVVAVVGVDVYRFFTSRGSVQLKAAAAVAAAGGLVGYLAYSTATEHAASNTSIFNEPQKDPPGYKDKP